jgi:hypothetical protein
MGKNSSMGKFWKYRKKREFSRIQFVHPIRASNSRVQFAHPMMFGKSLAIEGREGLAVLDS